MKYKITLRYYFYYIYSICIKFIIVILSLTTTALLLKGYIYSLFGASSNEGLCPHVATYINI